MPIIHNPGGSTTLTGDSIDYFQLCSIKGAVGLELKGIKICRGPVVWKRAREMYNIPKPKGRGQANKQGSVRLAVRQGEGTAGGAGTRIDRPSDRAGSAGSRRTGGAIVPVQVRFECGRDCVIGPTLGPFEFVQVTYIVMRDDKDNDIAWIEDGDWTISTPGYAGIPFSDFIIEAVQ